MEDGWSQLLFDFYLNGVAKKERPICSRRNICLCSFGFGSFNFKVAQAQFFFFFVFDCRSEKIKDHRRIVRHAISIVG